MRRRYDPASHTDEPYPSIHGKLNLRQQRIAHMFWIRVAGGISKKKTQTARQPSPLPDFNKAPPTHRSPPNCQTGMVLRMSQPLVQQPNYKFIKT